MRKRRFFAESDGDGGTLVDLTPLIDVVFVVLITFIVIAPLLQMDRVALAPGSGQKESVSPQVKGEIVLRVGRDETVTVNDELVRLRELPGRLIGLKEQFPSAVPKLFQDEKASFGSYQRVKNALEVAGYEELDIILKPER